MFERLLYRCCHILLLLFLFHSFVFLGIAIGADRQLVPIFYLSQETHVSGYRGEVNLGDVDKGRTSWVGYLSGKYPYVTKVIYGVSPFYTSGLNWDSIQIKNAVDAARGLGLTVYFLYPWARFYGREEATGQKNDRGEVDDDLPALQDERSRAIMRKFIRKTIETYQPDGILLDAFRYSNRNFGYSNLFIDSFQKEYPCPFAESWDFENLVQHTQDISGEYYQHWIRFREKEVGQLIEEMVAVARMSSKDKDSLQVGMFVAAPSTLHLREIIHGYGQLNTQHLHEAGIDFLIPMAYSTDPYLSFYNTISLKALGFKLWAGISAEEFIYPRDEDHFLNEILAQFQIVDTVVLYQDLFIGEEAGDAEVEALKDIAILVQDLHLVEMEDKPKVMFVYSNSDLTSLEGQNWWTDCYSVVRSCLENDIPVDFGLLNNFIDSEGNISIDVHEHPVLAFIRPYNFSTLEECIVNTLRNQGFSFVIINPNEFFLNPAVRKGVSDAQFVEVADDENKALLRAIVNEMGFVIDITKGKEINYVEYFHDLLPGWEADLYVTVNRRRFPIVISREFGNRKEVYSGLTPKSDQILSSHFQEIMKNIFLWVQQNDEH